MSRRAEQRWPDAEVPAILKRRRAAMRRRQRKTLNERAAVRLVHRLKAYAAY